MASGQPDSIGQAGHSGSGAPRFFAAGLIGACIGGAFLAWRQALPNDAVLWAAAAYAAVGVFFLLCAAFGVCRFGLKEAEADSAADILDNIAAAIVLTGKDGRFIYANKAYRQMTGAPPASPEILLGRDAGAAKAAWRLSQAAASGQALREIVSFSRNPFAPAAGAEKAALAAAPLAAENAGGDWRYCVDVRPFFAGGAVFAMWTIAAAAENGGAGALRRLQAAVDRFNNIPAGLLSWDKEGRLVFFNAALARLARFDAAQFAEALSLGNIFGQENAERIFAWEQKLRQDSAAAGREAGAAAEFSAALPLRLTDESGREREFCLYADARRAGDGLAHAVLLPPAAETADSSALGNFAAASGAAAAEEERQIDIEYYFYRSPIALAVIKRGLHYMRVNARFNALFGLAGQAAADRPPSEQADSAGAAERQSEAKRDILQFFKILAEADRERVMQAVEAAFKTGAEPAAPLDAVLPGEPTRYICLYITPMRASGRGCEAVILSLVETTRQRALEQQMEHSQKMQAVGQLAGGIAHDFNNVLTAIIMSCDLLLGNHRSSDPSHPDILNIKSNAGRAASLVRQLLAFSRRQTLRPEILDLTDMLADLRLLAVRLAGSAVRLKIEHGQALWPVKADQAELERVMMNLVANARDAMPQGGDLTIRTGNIGQEESRNLPYQGFQPGDYVLIEVADTGGGIAPDIMEKIFDPFFTTKEVGKGTGLGLSMVYGIVSQTGGYVYCRSAVGIGTVFSIYLPRYHAPEENSAGGGAEKALPPRNFARPLKKQAEIERAVDLSGSANVLLVEDEDAVRMGGAKALQSRGYTVFEAESGVEALRIVKERQGAIDIVVSDVVMPEMDGPTLLKELRQSYPNIKFIFVSGYAREAFAKNLPEDADFAFLAKPFSLKQLAGAVKEMLAADTNAAG